MTEPNRTGATKQRRKRRISWFAIGAVLAGFLIYAYGFTVTDVSLNEIQNEQRQTGLFRILRALAHPDVFERDTADTIIRTEIYVPCGPNEAAPPDTDGPYLLVDPPCSDPGTDVTVYGYNLLPGSTGPLAFIPTSEVELGLGNFRVGDDGTFATVVELKERPDTAVQYIQATARIEVGAIRFTQTARDTSQKAMETIFMALLATTFGTILAIPLSFLASRNLMRPIKSPMVSIGFGVIGLPVGLYTGIWATRLARRSLEPLNGNVLYDVIGIAVLVVVLLAVLRTVFPPVEPDEPPTREDRARNGMLLALAALATIGILYLIADALAVAGNWLTDGESWFARARPGATPTDPDIPAGWLNFIANFIFQIGDLLRIATPVFATLIAAGAFAQFGSRLGRFLVTTFGTGVERSLRYVTAAAAGAVVGLGLGRIIEWLYEWDNAMRTVWIPVMSFAALGLFLAWSNRKLDQVSTGLTVYYLARTLFNTLRSIEPLVMAIIFVVWVGIGPFAGSLALALHTTAALAKLYSEQVESISSGPIEAVTATGANRLQTVMYAVVPQIIPPYISFTLYRWDINVRMSTIIGFVGGGGLGLILQQNVNLLNYRAAAVQMFAIAIIVASMDYLSAKLRERLV